MCRALDAWECWWWELGGGLFPESPALSLRPSSIHPHSGTHPRSHNHEKHRAKNTGWNMNRGLSHRLSPLSTNFPKKNLPQETGKMLPNRASHIKNVAQKLFTEICTSAFTLHPQLGALAQFPVPTQKCGLSSFRALLVCAFWGQLCFASSLWMVSQGKLMSHKG